MSFVIQPVFGKILLSEMGGGAGVWVVANIAFQAILLVGYLYALCLLRAGARTQLFFHTAVLLLTTLALGWGIHSGSDRGWIFGLGVVGACVVLSSTSPLIQAWLAERSETWKMDSVYRLFAFSNLAGIVALFSYPFFIETTAGISVQLRVWSAMFFIYALFIFHLATRYAKSSFVDQDVERRGAGSWTWIVFPLLSTCYLLSVTTAFTQNVPSSPFIWTAPLALYLLSYSLAFAGWGHAFLRTISAAGVLILLPLVTLNSGSGARAFSVDNFAMHCAMLFLGCLLLHIELYRRRPGKNGLPLFYFFMSVGGMLGGVAVAMLIPYAFAVYTETWFFHFLGGGLAAWLLFSTGATAGWRAVAWSVRLSLLAAIVFLYWDTGLEISDGGRVVRSGRNFHGAYRVLDYDTPFFIRVLEHGGIRHGAQHTSKGELRKASTYYTSDGGGGRAFLAARGAGKPLHIVCIGVGVGAVAGWVERGDSLTFIDVDPNVIRVAEECFTYIGDARKRGAEVNLVAGDGRRVAEALPKEVADLVIVDAFSGSGIPVHLLTKEALSSYLSLLGIDGILAIHVSSPALDLAGVVAGGLGSLAVEFCIFRGSGGEGGLGSSWVVAAKSGPRISSRVGGGCDPVMTKGSWSDDFSPIYPFLKR